MTSTVRIIGSSVMNVTGDDVRRELEEEIASVGLCCLLPSTAKASAMSYLAAMDRMDNMASMTEAAVKACIERSIIKCSDMEEQAILLLRAHSLREIGDSKGCWRLLQTYDDSKLRQDVATDVDGMRKCIERLEVLEVSMAETKSRNAETKAPLGAAHSKLERAKKFISEDSDAKSMSAAKLVQSVSAVMMSVVAAKGMVDECSRMSGNGGAAELAADLSRTDLVKVLQNARTTSERLLRIDKKKNRSTLVW